MELRPSTRPITGTHVYTSFRCQHQVVLDACGDRSLRRELRPEEEFLLARGRDHEARIVVELEAAGWREPEFAERDFATGAAATRALLEDGVPGVLQGVLLAEAAEGGLPRLGIPDLVRRLDGLPAGATARAGEGLGATFHYEIGDVKSSARPRGDQILQVVFYARLLERLQGCLPDEGYLLLKDGREERFGIADYLPVLDGIERRVESMQLQPAGSRPFLSNACGKCRWSDVCVPELEQADDLSLVDGMTRGVADTLRGRAGVTTVREAASMPIEETARRAGLDANLLRRLQRAAFATTLGRPVPERRPRAGAAERRSGPTVLVAAMFDAFADRMLWIGAALRRTPKQPFATLRTAAPRTVDEEWPAVLELAGYLPDDPAVVWHVGPALPRWLDDRAFASGEGEPPAPLDPSTERFLDLQRRARVAAHWPRPASGFDDLVRMALDRDPHRAGRIDEAAWRLVEDESDGRSWLDARGEVLLTDMADVLAWLESGAGASGTRADDRPTRSSAVGS